jgi:hypothetical protein
VLIDGLPPESLTMTALRIKDPGPGGDVEVEAAEPADAPWSKSDILIAALIDAVNQNTWAVFQSQSEEEVPKPELVPRPGVAKAKPRYAKADPLLVEWLTKRQNGEDTTDLDAQLNLQNVTPLRPMTKRGGGDGGHRGGSKP